MRRRSYGATRSIARWALVAGVLAQLLGGLVAATAANAQVDDTRRGLASNGLCGLGLTAFPVCPKRIGVSATASYGYTESIGPVDGAHNRVGGTLGAGWTALPWLSVALQLDGRLDLHPKDERGKDLTGTGEPRLFIRGGHALKRNVSLGGELVAWFPGNIAPSFEPRATTVDLKALLSWTPPTQPFSVLGFSGYRFDQSAQSAPDPRQLRPGDLSALGVSASDAVLLAVGGVYRLPGHARVRDSELFAEVALDVLVGDKAPSFSQSPMRGTLGGRYFFHDALQAELSATIAFSSRPSIASDMPLVPIEPRFLLRAGIRYGYDPYVAPPAPVDRSEHRAVDEPSTTAKTASIRGRLVDADAAPLPDVRITLTALGPPPQAPIETVTDGEGVYSFADVQVGPAELEATAPGFETLKWTLEVSPDMAAEQERPLTRQGNLGTLRLLTRTFASEPLQSAIIIRDARGKKVAAGKANEQGLFEFELTPGRYVVMISAAGYQPHRREVQVERHGVAILNVDMREQK